MWFRLLGPPELGPGEQQARQALRNERPGQLLAYLAFRGDWIARDELAALFWPDDPDAAARRNLRWVLHAARSLVGDALEADRQRVRLCADSDLRAFEAALAAGEHAQAAKRCAGPLLAGFESGAGAAFQQWLAAEREHLRARFADSAAHAAQAALTRDPASAQSMAERILEGDPTDERALALLLQALAAQGRIAEARKRYAAFAAQLLDDLHLEPSPGVQRLARSLDQTPAATVAAAVPPPDQFIGRAEELAQLSALLAQPDCRLITVLGSGGVGKSRLIAEFFARGLVQSAHLVSLEALTLPAQIPGAVAAALGLATVGGQPVEGLVARALQSSCSLLALDNFEQVIDGASILARWLQGCPALRIVVTSRERLALDEEWLLPLAGLTAQGDNPDGEAVRLFVARARAVDPAFDAGGQMPQVARIARLVDGMPLALELAAAAVRLLPCRDIADDIERSLELLSLPRAGHGEAGVSASVARSWALLTVREREAFMRIAVFAAPFSAAAAREVTGVSAAALALLGDKSMLHREPVERLKIHPLLRQFGAARLAENPQLETEVRTRHAEHMAATLSAVQGTATRVARIGDEFPDVLAAWQWSITRGRIDLHLALVPLLAGFFRSSGRLAEGRDLFDRTVAGLPAGPSDALGPIDAARATMRLAMGEAEAAESIARKALRAASAVHDRRTQTRCLLTIGEALRTRGQARQARPYLAQAEKRAAASGDIGAVAQSLRLLALIDKQEGQYPAALAKLVRVELLSRELDDRFGLVQMFNNRGNLLNLLGDSTAARGAFAEGLRLALQWRVDAILPFIYINLATHAFEGNDFEAAREHAEQSLAQARRQGVRHIELGALCVVAAVHAVRGAKSAARACLAQAAGVQAPFAAMHAIAITFARVLTCEGEALRACAVARMVQRDVRASEPDRHIAGVEVETARRGLSVDEQGAAETLAASLTLESVLAEVAQAAH